VRAVSERPCPGWARQGGRALEKEYVHKDGSRVPVCSWTTGAARRRERRGETVAFVVDLLERKEAEERSFARPRELAGSRG